MKVLRNEADGKEKNKLLVDLGPEGKKLAKELFQRFLDLKGLCDKTDFEMILESGRSIGCVGEEFLKVYDKEKTPNPNVVPLYYGGVTDRDGMVRGKWDETPENVKYGYAFCMHPFIKGRAMTKLLDERRYE